MSRWRKAIKNLEVVAGPNRHDARSTAESDCAESDWATAPQYNKVHPKG